MLNAVKIHLAAPLEFAVNFFPRADMKIRKIRRAGGGCEFWVGAGDYKKFDKIMKNRGGFEILKDNSVGGFVRNNIFRFGLYLGFFAVIFAMAFYSARITRVKIGGNKLVPGKNILEAVEKNVSLPCPKKNLDVGKLRNDVINLDGVSSASVEVRGNTLFVDVYEELEKVELFGGTDYEDSLSKYDGVITRIYLYSGSTDFKAGDVVKKGDVLIRSAVDSGDGPIARERAFGEVYGRVWVSEIVPLPQKVMTKKPTGKEVVEFSFFGKEKKSEPDFVFEKEVAEARLPNILPLKIRKTIYREIEYTEEEIDFEKNKEGIIAEYTKALEKKLPPECKKIRCRYDIKTLDKNTGLVIYYEIETKLN